MVPKTPAPTDFLDEPDAPTVPLDVALSEVLIRALADPQVALVMADGTFCSWMCKLCQLTGIHDYHYSFKCNCWCHEARSLFQLMKHSLPTSVIPHDAGTTETWELKQQLLVITKRCEEYQQEMERAYRQGYDDGCNATLEELAEKEAVKVDLSPEAIKLLDVPGSIISVKK